MNVLKTCSLALLAALALAAAPATALAQDYPNKPVRMIVAYPAGTGVDLLARQIAPFLAAELGQPIVVDNLGGASGALGTAEAAKAEADGYTIVFATAGTHAANPSLQTDLGYDPVADFAPIGFIGDQALTLGVNAALPVNTVQELIDYAKANDGAMNFATTGAGGGPYFAGLLFNLQAGVNVTHVPYNSATQALTELSNGSVQMMFYNYQALLPFIEGGGIKAIATTGEERLAVVPDLPTVKEAGLPDFTAGTWYALYAPDGTPADAIDKVYAALQRAMDTPDLRTQVADAGLSVRLESAEEMGDFTAREVERYAQMVAAAPAE